MTLPLQNFSALVEQMAAAVQGASTSLLDLTVGSVLRAILEANASLALWLQWLLVQLLAVTRAATSNGADLDSWVADFSVFRLPATAASGPVTFARFSTGQPALVPAGAVVATADGSQQFTVLADPSNVAWSPAQNGFSVPVAASTISLTVQASVPGSGGNVQAGAIDALGTAIPGIDTVVNAAPFQNGVDAESDAALRTRFQSWAASLSRATPVAITAAVLGVQQGLTCLIAEGVDTSGAARVGNFVVTVDDGSGSPPASLLATAATAIEAVRPAGVTYAVQPPVVVPVQVALTIAVNAPGVKATLAPAVAASITEWIDALPIGAPLPLSRIPVLAYAVDPTIANVTAITLNGTAADLLTPGNGVVKASGGVTVN
ncbi:MAG TPA: baseplate J/gp47 family protein [Acetobacteraceae bacterium]|jgi:uncharacterized phage protein gp47/JayE|nr:baseplate J/gp47 family protein [Acetobacteraceae bacterium]